MSDYDLLKDDVYSLRKEGDGLRVTKFTKDLNPVGFYHLNPSGDFGYTCNCPQSNRGACKHLDIADAFDLYPERVDKGWFFCHQTGDWFPPVRDAERPQGDAEQGVQLSRQEPVSTGEQSAVVDAAEQAPPAPTAPPEVEGVPPPPSGVFNRRGL